MTQECAQHLEQVTAESRLQVIVSSRLWRHAFGEMLIETRADGTVLIDGRPVADKLPPSPSGEPGGEPPHEVLPTESKGLS